MVHNEIKYLYSSKPELFFSKDLQLLKIMYLSNGGYFPKKWWKPKKNSSESMFANIIFHCASYVFPLFELYRIYPLTSWNDIRAQWVNNLLADRHFVLLLECICGFHEKDSGQMIYSENCLSVLDIVTQTSRKKIKRTEISLNNVFCGRPSMNEIEKKK